MCDSLHDPCSADACVSRPPACSCLTVLFPQQPEALAKTRGPCSRHGCLQCRKPARHLCPTLAMLCPLGVPEPQSLEILRGCPARRRLRHTYGRFVMRRHSIAHSSARRRRLASSLSAFSSLSLSETLYIRASTLHKWSATRCIFSVALTS
jgi:hypothetical protein